ncbi:hypothetical protein B296_00053133 [Ensete ventricosum]|uniref:Uncharacterized protein n=1 Tax=Ensete ventricosum TaxID=4639 RepID=A0A426XQM7_ENSVE|nr:hypothetical protein B296_00053133 [Ensete ventricosum]
MPAYIASPFPRTPWDRSRELLLYASLVATLWLVAFVRWSFEPLVPPLVLEYAAVACLPRFRASPSLLRRSALVSRTTSPPRSPIPSSLSTGVSPDPLGVHRRRFLLLAWERNPVPLLTPTPFRKPIRLHAIDRSLWRGCYSGPGIEAPYRGVEPFGGCDSRGMASTLINRPGYSLPTCGSSRDPRPSASPIGAALVRLLPSPATSRSSSTLGGDVSWAADGSLEVNPVR